MMNWNEQFSRDQQPQLSQIAQYIGLPLWDDLCAYVEQTYAVAPHVEHSVCSGAPGWNIKYRKSGRALCTLYPARGYFTCLVSVGTAEATEAEMILNTCTEYLRELYGRAKPFNGSRWLMVDVTDAAILEDAKRLIALRVKPKK